MNKMINLKIGDYIKFRDLINIDITCKHYQGNHRIKVNNNEYVCIHCKEGQVKQLVDGISTEYVMGFYLCHNQYKAPVELLKDKISVDKKLYKLNIKNKEFNEVLVISIITNVVKNLLII